MDRDLELARELWIESQDTHVVRAKFEEFAKALLARVRREAFEECARIAEGRENSSSNAFRRAIADAIRSLLAARAGNSGEG